MTDRWIGRAVSVATSRARDTPVHVKSRRWCVRPRPRGDETATARRRIVGWKNRGEKTTDDGRRGRGIKLAAWIPREPHHHHHHHRRWGESPTTTRDDARRRFVSVTARRRNRTMRVIFSPPPSAREGRTIAPSRARPVVVRRRDEPPLARGFAGDDDAIGPRSVRDRSIGDRSGRRRRVVASSRWIRMGDISLRPFSPGVVLGRRRRGTAGTANARAHPRVGSGWVRPRAHVSPSSALGRRRVDFFFLDFQSTMMPFDES